jgi:hypothetical protein
MSTNFEFRIWNFDWFRSFARLLGLARRDRNDCQFVGFVKQRSYPCQIQQFRGYNHLQPETRFVGFLLDYARLMGEVGLGFCPAQGPIVCRNQAAAADDLIRNRIAAASCGQSVDEVKDP